MLSFTYENEADSDEISQYIASDRFIVSPVTFSKEADERVELVLTETLVEKQRDNHISATPYGICLVTAVNQRSFKRSQGLGVSRW